MALKAGYKGIKKCGPGLKYDNLTGTLKLDGESDMSLDNLKDVAIDTPVDGDVLMYDGSNEEWYNEQPDSVPTEDSANLVTSGGVYAAIKDVDVTDLVPEDASTSNKLTTASDVADRVSWPTNAVLGAKNRFNYDAWKGLPITRGTAVFENNGVTLTSTGADCYTSYSDSYPVSARIPVNEGDKIKLTWESTETTNLGNVLLMGNGETSSIVSANNTVGKVEYTVPSGITYVNVRFGVTASGNTIHYKNIMVYSASDTDPTYVPYAMTNGELTDKVFDKEIILRSGDDLNNITESGMYRIYESVTNTPENVSYASLLVHKIGTTTIEQVIFKAGTIYSRIADSNPMVWHAWYKFTGTAIS